DRAMIGALHHVVHLAVPALMGENLISDLHILDEFLSAACLDTGSSKETTFDIMYVAIFVCDYQRPLKLAHILSIDAEVRLEGNLYLDALRYVNETSPAPHSTVERGELVVVGGNDGRPVLA